MEIFQLGFRAMGCACEMAAAFPDEAAARAGLGQALAEVERIEAKYSRYQPDSVTSRINAAAASAAWFECDQETLDLLDHGDYLHRLSDGLFDMTAGVFRRVWDFQRAEIPSAEAIAGVRQQLGCSRVAREGQRVRLEVGMELDFGGFGKEYAVDRAAEVLLASGCQHGIVNLGGDVRVIGPKPDGTPWGVGIQDPRQPGKLLASIPLLGGGLATSGDYERFFELEGRRYCHIINPLNGYPVTEWQSISVLAPTALIAGGMATIAMLREQGAIDFLKARARGFLAIDQHKRIFTHQGA